MKYKPSLLASVTIPPLLLAAADHDPGKLTSRPLPQPDWSKYGGVPC